MTNNEINSENETHHLADKHFEKKTKHLALWKEMESIL